MGTSVTFTGLFTWGIELFGNFDYFDLLGNFGKGPFTNNVSNLRGDRGSGMCRQSLTKGEGGQ